MSDPLNHGPAPKERMPLMLRLRRTRGRQGGQALVLMVLALVAMLGMVALIVDGGNAFATQRAVQNGADAAADAGAVVLAQNVGHTTPVMTDADVLAAVDTAASDNSLSNPVAYYTDDSGNLLTLAGTTTTSTLDAVQVGSGAIPPCLTNCPSAPSYAAGVQVDTSKTIRTYVAGAIGVNSIGVAAQATAVSGYLSSVCNAQEGCAVLPVGFPVNTISCSNQNNLVNGTSQWPEYTVQVVPLCSGGPGNVGWLDWTPPYGGTSDLISEISNPNNPAIQLPSWQYIGQTGNVNSAGVESAINAYDGQIVLVPQFDSTCNTQPSNDTLSGCPAANVGGTGQNQWYHIPAFAAFQLCSSTNPACVAAGYTQGAYINGGDGGVCGSGNGATGCLVGEFVNFITQGVVGPGAPGSQQPSTVIGVQLIR